MSMSEPQSLPATNAAAPTGPGLAKTRHPAREPQNSAADITVNSTWHGRLHGNADRRPTVLSEPYTDAHGSMRVKTRIGNRVLTPLLNSFLSDYAIDRATVAEPTPAAPSEPAIVAPPAEPAAPAHPVTIDVTDEEPVLYESHGVVAGQVRTAAAFDARNGTVSRVVVEPGDAKTFTVRGVWPSHVPHCEWRVDVPAHEIATRWPKVETPPFPTVSDPIVSKAATFLPFSAFSAPATQRGWPERWRSLAAPTSPTPDPKPLLTSDTDAWFGQELRVYPATQDKPAQPVAAPAEPPAAAPEPHGVEVGQTRAGDNGQNNGTVVRIRVTRGDADTLVIKPIWPSRVPSADWCVALTASDIATRWPAVVGYTSQAALGAMNTPLVDNKADVSPFAAQATASGFVAIQQQTSARVPDPATATSPAAPPPEPTVMHVESTPLATSDAEPPPEAQVCDPFAMPPPDIAKCKADLTEYLMDHPGNSAELVRARMRQRGHVRAATDIAFAEMVRDGQAGMFTSDGNVCWTLLTPRALASVPTPVADPAPPTPAQEDEALLALLDGYSARKIREAATHAVNDIGTLYGVTPATLRPRDVIRTLVVRALGGWSGSGLVK